MTLKKTSARKSAGKPSTTARPEQAKDIASEGNVDQIRDILFGSQMKEYDRKFQRLEERLSKEVARSRDELNKRTDTLETYLKKEIETINEHIRQEKQERCNGDKELAGELKKTAKSLDDRLTKLDEKLATTMRDLRKEILEQSKALTHDISTSQQESAEALDRTAAELRDVKLDRSSISELLTEMAIRIARDSSYDEEFDSDELEKS